MFKVALLDQTFSQSDSVNIVGRDQNIVSLGHIRDDTLQVIIIALVRAFYRVEHRRGVTFCCGKLSFFEHVGSSNKLYSQVEAILFCACHFHRYQVLGTRGIALVAIHDDDLVATVQFMGQLLAK
jgi:hypothetical protein